MDDKTTRLLQRCDELRIASLKAEQFSEEASKYMRAVLELHDRLKIHRDDEARALAASRERWRAALWAFLKPTNTFLHQLQKAEPPRPATARQREPVWPELTSTSLH